MRTGLDPTCIVGPDAFFVPDGGSVGFRTPAGGPAGFLTAGGMTGFVAFGFLLSLPDFLLLMTVRLGLADRRRVDVSGDQPLDGIYDFGCLEWQALNLVKCFKG